MAVTKNKENDSFTTLMNALSSEDFSELKTILGESEI